MALFQKQKTQSHTQPQPILFERLYQYADGSFLPDTSQPNPDENYEITTGAYTPHTSTRYINVTIGSNGKAQSRGKDCEKELPELYTQREDCCGCTACYAICPVHAIIMRPDEEGFDYPVVTSSVCIRCYKCVNVCPIKQRDKENGEIDERDERGA
ncbi:MAG: 4Fe-4S dicluster domain-containing protein [Clostridiales bacterium]|nr:4Fe-4S dicluster domain-containing protein [Clostridiales bacterium]